MAERQDIGRNIRRARLLREKRQSDLGAALGVSQAIVSRWESGKFRITAEKLHEIAQVLNVAIEELYSPIHLLEYRPAWTRSLTK